MMKSLTKLIATIGPATETAEMMAKLIDAGMSVARFNTKHSSPQWHQERIERMRQVAASKGVSVGILLDLQGPEIRINLPEEKPFTLQEGESYFFTFAFNPDYQKQVLIPQNVIDTLQLGHTVLLDDGACELEVIGKQAEFLQLKALGDCEVKHRKTMNVPGVTIDMPALVEADYQQLDEAAGKNNVDFVGLSFVRSSEDIEFLREQLAQRQMQAKIIAKIENQAALNNLAAIVTASDAVMVARGDLGVEMPYEELVYWQKEIINLCHEHAKPVIVATHMLKSMTEQPRPTRAEVSDVTHAIYDGTDAIMLSEETTIGKYPLKAVATQAKIAAFNEAYVDYQLPLRESGNKDSAIANAVLDLIETSGMKVDHIVILTESGESAHNLSCLHPSLPIIAVTGQKHTYAILSLVYGALPVLVEPRVSGDFLQVVDELKKRQLLKSGEKIVMTHGIPNQVGGTNTISILDIK